MEPCQTFSACSVPPSARDSGKLLASPPSATTQASFGRVKDSNVGVTQEALNRDSIATPHLTEKELMSAVLTEPFSQQDRHRISLLDEEAAWLQTHPATAMSIPASL